jgi:hypothetical protein
MKERLDIPPGVLFDDDDVVSVLMNMFGDVWVLLIRDDEPIVVGSDIDWRTVDENTVLSWDEKAWMQNAQDLLPERFHVPAMPAHHYEEWVYRCPKDDETWTKRRRMAGRSPLYGGMLVHDGGVRMHDWCTPGERF